MNATCDLTAKEIAWMEEHTRGCEHAQFTLCELFVPPPAKRWIRCDSCGTRSHKPIMEEPRID